MEPLTDSPRVRSDSASSSASQGSKMVLRQRLSQLLTCIEDMSSDDEAGEEVSRTLDEAFQLCGRFIPTDAFRLTFNAFGSWKGCKNNHFHAYVDWSWWKGDTLLIIMVEITQKLDRLLKWYLSKIISRCTVGGSGVLSRFSAFLLH